ncbi:MAG TPA: HAMP domain-containing sensor histidine kinase [Streptosporangiaceae bacterium]|nr:HAMP domain-containing sensor histidine kinase [Streptosporangiaceae bacterium]
MRWPGPSLQRRLAAALGGMLLLGWPVAEGVTHTIQNLWWSRDYNVGYSCGNFRWPVVSPPASGCAPYSHNTAMIVLVVLLLFLAALVATCWVVAGRLLASLTLTAQTVRQLGPQNLGQRIRLGGSRDALRELADAIDDALDRLASGYDSQRRFAANASHELRTPLAAQRLLTEVAMDAPQASADLNRLGLQLLRTSERSEKLIEGLLVLAESDRGLPGKVPVRLDELAAAALDAHEELAGQQGVTLRRTLARRLVPGDPVLLEQLLGNLLRNAIAYNEPGGWVQVVVASEPALLVTNSGPQVPAEAVPVLFEPFRRLGADRTSNRGGAGLGLSIVRSVTTAHHGMVSARPRPGGGLSVAIELPCDDRPQLP